MNLECAEKVAEAVLYEGHMLYPYRPSSVKNRQRWNFGVLFPRQDSTAILYEPCSMQTECLLRAGGSSRITVKVRFLQIVQRSTAQLRAPITDVLEDTVPEAAIVDRLELAGKVYYPWQEAVERELCYSSLNPDLLLDRYVVPFSFCEGHSIEYLRDDQQMVAGAIDRHWNSLTGSVEISLEWVREGVAKITARVQNHKHREPAPLTESSDRETLLLDSLVSAHIILGVENGEFISLLEYPDDFEDIIASCVNVGAFPVLAGEGGDTVLSSPIILYDHPKIAPESAGNLFDSTEIDEILSLRILTLTDAEKQEMRQSDDRTRAILERTESMPEEQFAKLHGVLRGMTFLEEEAQ